MRMKKSFCWFKTSENDGTAPLLIFNFFPIKSDYLREKLHFPINQSKKSLFTTIPKESLSYQMSSDDHNLATTFSEIYDTSKILFESGASRSLLLTKRSNHKLLLNGFYRFRKVV